MFFVINKNKIISILILMVAVVAVITTIPNSDLQVNASPDRLLPIYSVDTQDKKVALTINCAWENTDIDKILDTLKQYNVNVTFFVVGDFAKKYPESVKAIYDAGNEIGNHSFTHPHVNNLSLEDNIKQIQDCNNLLKEITGTIPTLYRAPYGEYNNTVIKSSKEVGMNAIQWNVDSLDYTGLSKEDMWKRIEKGVGPGSIILMHSGTKNTADALGYIIQNLQNMKYDIVKVSDLIYKEDFYINHQGMQKQNK